MSAGINDDPGKEGLNELVLIIATSSYRMYLSIIIVIIMNDRSVN